MSIESLNMFAATALGRNNDCNCIGTVFQNKRTYEGIGIKLILVVANAEECWLQGSKIEFEQRLLKLRKIWKADILVLNKQMAQKYGLAKES